MSALETGVNLVVGYLVSAILTYLVLPVFGYQVTGGHAVAISGVFTAASVARSYVLRRIFAGLVT